MKSFVRNCTALIALSTFTMAAERWGDKSEKTNINLSTASLALDHYLAVTTKGESVGVEQLFTDDFNQKIQATAY